MDEEYQAFMLKLFFNRIRDFPETVGTCLRMLTREKRRWIAEGEEMFLSIFSHSLCRKYSKILDCES